MSAAWGWDSATNNANDGNSFDITANINFQACGPNSGQHNAFCQDAWIAAKQGTYVDQATGKSSFMNKLHVGYEPALGVLVDLNLIAVAAMKVTPTAMTPDIHGGAMPHKLMPITWMWNYVHLPMAINMDLAKLQLIPQALNGLYIFLLAQCMVSLIGGF